jgi:hypothetical protein
VFAEHLQELELTLVNAAFSDQNGHRSMDEVLGALHVGILLV